MNYYTQITPFELAKKLKDAGFPQDTECGYNHDGSLSDDGAYEIAAAPTYAGVLDWLIEKGCFVFVVPSISPNDYKFGEKVTEWDGFLNGEIISKTKSFTVAANETIDAALELIRKADK